MKRIISIGIVIFLLLSILTACEKGENGSITTSDQTQEESLEQTPVLERELRLDTVTKEAPDTDTQAIYSYKYYDDYIECNLASNVYNIIYYDKYLKTAYVGYSGESIDDIKKGEWVHSHNLKSHLDEEVEYSLVGSAEADPMNFKISNESPVGAALLGKKVGDLVEVSKEIGLSADKDFNEFYMDYMFFESEEE